MNIRVFNADDHPILKKGITDLIIETEDMEWVGSGGDGQEALDKIRSIIPDIAILDIEMPHYSGLEIAKTLIYEGIKTEFILLTLFKDASFFNSALALGVKGYLLKESTAKEILDCIRSVYAGMPYVTPSLTKYLISKKQFENDSLSKLSEQEMNIVKLIAMQKTSAEIAEMLFISPKTVSNHRSNISKKLDLGGAQNALLKWAIEHMEELK